MAKFLAGGEVKFLWPILRRTARYLAASRDETCFCHPGAIYFDPGRFPEPLVVRDNSLLTRGASDLLYYSFVTLGTVGYGDVTPSSPAARSLSLIEAVIGIMYVATMIARFVSIQTNVEGRSFEPEHTDAARIDSGPKTAADEKFERR